MYDTIVSNTEVGGMCLEEESRSMEMAWGWWPEGRGLNNRLLWKEPEQNMGFPAQTVKTLLAMQETWVQSLGWEDPLEKKMETHSSILAWRIPWTEEPGWLQSMRSQIVSHVWVKRAEHEGDARRHQGSWKWLGDFARRWLILKTWPSCAQFWIGRAGK